MKKGYGIFERLAEAVFPSKLYCISCGALIDRTRNYALCDDCIKKIKWATERTCEKCGKLLRDDNHHELCNDCREITRYFDKGYTCCLYDDLTRQILMDFKFNGHDELGLAIGDALADRMKYAGEDIDMVTSVPVHESRLVQRGYNQAEVMAKRYVRKTDSNICYAELLKRTKKTSAMKSLDVAGRQANVENAFEIRVEKKHLIEGKTIAVVDDIFTTGSTLDECSRMLKEAGAKRVIVVTFAAGADAGASELQATASKRH